MNLDAGTPLQIEVPRVRVLPDGRMTRENAATYLGLKPKTLAMWAMEGKGPPACRVGSRVFYYKNDLDAFIRGEVMAVTTAAPVEQAA